MNVDQAEWNWALLTTLKRISEAHCVAFDLELSGIPVRKQRGATQTLQDRYLELKAAAEKYHILQVGLTLVEEDVDHDKYVLRTFNYNLSPLVEDIFNMDRDFTYSTGAVQFLLRNNYSMDSPFVWGIPYLKPDEEELARKNYLARWDRSAIPNISIRAEDTESFDMVTRLREEVKAWIAKNQLHEEYVFTGTPFDPTDPEREQQQDQLGSFQRRLVHQTIRNEFPALTTYGRRDFVAIKPKNEKQEAESKEKDERMLTQALYRQRAFRFITDALAGRDWRKGIDTGVVGRRILGEDQAETTVLFKQRLRELEESLKAHQTILVGHNCFLDLVYIYHNFYGPLPDKVQEFHQALHETFPLIIDTKYMATVNKPYESRALQLYQIAEGLSKSEKPVIEDSVDHPAYLNNEERYHEAGYDSYQTAKTFLRLSGALEAEGDYLMDELSDSALAAMRTPDIPLTPNAEAQEENQLPSSCELSVELGDVTGAKKKKNKKNKTADLQSGSASKYSHSNSFNVLLDHDDEDSNQISAETPASTSNAVKPAAASPNLVNEFSKLDLSKRRNGGSLIPSWNTVFWNVYGNKMRVFGTVEEVSDLTGKPTPSCSTGQHSSPSPPESSAQSSSIARERQATMWQTLQKWIPG